MNTMGKIKFLTESYSKNSNERTHEAPINHETVRQLMVLIFRGQHKRQKTLNWLHDQSIAYIYNKKLKNLDFRKRYYYNSYKLMNILHQDHPLW